MTVDLDVLEAAATETLRWKTGDVLTSSQELEYKLAWEYYRGLAAPDVVLELIAEIRALWRKQGDGIIRDAKTVGPR